ncbi:hypothetical protein M3Y99_00485300 [Aphelenchoides fujianensis]|nr:hypothetical protein M3Y99_00485300 [Aphelenchoides fujianensis]
MSRPIPKAERPWRQRMADSARMRNLEDVDAPRSSALSPSSTALMRAPPGVAQRHAPSVFNAATPTSSVALRNYESKFKKYGNDPPSRPTSLVLASSSLTNKYRPRTSITSATAGLGAGGLLGLAGGNAGGGAAALSRTSSTASSNLSLLSAMPTTTSSRFRASTASTSYVPPLSISTRYSSSATPTARRLASSIMSRSYSTHQTAYTTHGATAAAMAITYLPRNRGGDEMKRMGEGTRWRPVEQPPPVERKSRRDRSGSAKRRRSRSRSTANEPPPPGSSSDSAPENDDERVPPRVRKLRKRNSDKALNQETTGVPPTKPDKQKQMPASAAQFEPTDGGQVADVVADAKVDPLLQHSDAAMDSSIHSTITTDSMRMDVAEDESKYNAVARFKPASLRQKRASPKPVPGTWSYAANEVNISQNKAFKRRPAQVIVEITMKHFPFARASTAHFRMPRKKATVRPQLVESKTIGATFMRPKQQNMSTSVTIKNKKPTLKAAASLSLRERRPPLRLTADAHVSETFANRRRVQSAQEKTALRCKATSDRGKLLNLNISRKPETRACNGTVKDESEVTFAAVESGVAAPLSVQITLTRPPAMFSPTHTFTVEDPGGISSPEPYEPQIHVPVHRNARPGDPLILPDRSVLEEYVKRKRAHLESFNRQFPVGSDSSVSPPLQPVAPRNAPPAFGQPATSSAELQAACPVRILEPHIQTALITTPTRSRVSSVEPPSLSTDDRSSMTPRPNEVPATVGGPVRHVPVVLQHAPSGVQRDVQQLVVAAANPAVGPNQHQPQPQAAQQQQGGLFRGVLRKTSDPTGGALRLKAQIFDTPKSPFEERMQQQANQLRKASVGSSDTDNESAAGRPRHSVDGGVAQGFAAAVAQQPQRHERYAAHIPVPSGRQSVTSMDSVNSGALDTASRQLDQMIDQARYKHQQHRTKFKEAIDYLDQIFEDLKKECEPTSPNGNDARSPPSERNPPSAAAAQLQRQHSGTQLKPKAFPVHTNANLQPPREHPRLQKSVSQDAAGQDAKAVGRTIQQPPQQQQQQQRIIQPIRVGPQLQQQSQQPPQQSGVQRPVGQRLPLKKQRSNVEGGDVEVSQTIVLPSKNTAERLDFTRQWLSDDIRSWVDRPAAGNDAVLSGDGAARGALKQIASDQSSEHSLGSCSAEVAAINATEKRRKSTNGAAGEAAAKAGGTGVKTKKTTNPQLEAPKQTAQPVVAAPTAAAPAPNAAGGPIKPRAWRPQAGGSQQPAPPLGGLIGMAVEHAYELQKMGSQQELARPATRESLDRPGSHDYQSIGSTHSTDGLRSANFNSLQRSVSGAFVQYPQRGSIQSLPDAVLVAGNTRFAQLAPAGSSATLQPGGVYANGTTLHHAPSNTSGYGSTLGSTHHLQPHDPVLAMNTLIAELDLNTDQQPSPTAHHNEEAADKRRSFPTTQTEVTFRAGGRSQSIGQPNATSGAPTASSPGPTRLNVPQQPIYTGSMDRGMRKIQQQQHPQQQPQLQQTMNPFTSKVLGPQKPQQPRDPQRAQFEDAAHLLDSVIDELQPKSPSPTAKKRGMLHQLLSGGKSQPPAVNAAAVHRTPLAQKQQAAVDGGSRPFLIGSKKPTGAVIGNTTQPLQPKPSPTTTIRSVVGGGKKTVINPPKPNAHLHGHGAVVGGQQGRAAGHETSLSNPFETINSERANPSRVETLGSMFEQRPAQHANVRAAAPQRGPSFRRHNSRDSDPAYSEIGEFGRAEEQQQQQAIAKKRRQ